MQTENKKERQEHIMVWSKERIWNWYNARPWIRGCNYMSADCANRVDQWQSLGFEERLETTDRELALAASIGFNSIRIILEFVVWDEEHDSFLERFDRYLDVCAKHGISCMVVLANDCMRPKGAEVNRLGPQTVQKALTARKFCRYGSSCAGRARDGTPVLRDGPGDGGAVQKR